MKQATYSKRSGATGRQLFFEVVRLLGRTVAHHQRRELFAVFGKVSCDQGFA
jgi:hypothetical protein